MCTMLFLLIAATCPVFATAARSNRTVQSKAVEGGSFIQAATKVTVRIPRYQSKEPDREGQSSMQVSASDATISAAGHFPMDPFEDLEDSFAVPAVPSKSSVQQISLSSVYDTYAWISASFSPDLFVMVVVGFLFPLFAERVLRVRSLRKVAGEPQLKKMDRPDFAAPRKQSQRQRHLVANLGELMQAARSGHEARWRSSLDALPNSAHANDAFGCTALHVAANAGCMEMAKVLLDAGANVNVRDAWDETPLHFAARTGNSEVCELLLANSAELDAVNLDGVTPMVAAAKANNEFVCQLLLDRGATCQGISDVDVPPLLLSLLMHRMILPPSDQHVVCDSSVSLRRDGV